VMGRGSTLGIGRGASALAEGIARVIPTGGALGGGGATDGGGAGSGAAGTGNGGSGGRPAEAAGTGAAGRGAAGPGRGGTSGCGQDAERGLSQLPSLSDEDGRTADVESAPGSLVSSTSRGVPSSSAEASAFGMSRACIVDSARPLENLRRTTRARPLAAGVFSAASGRRQLRWVSTSRWPRRRRAARVVSA
jgi:hypothetical protein